MEKVSKQNNNNNNKKEKKNKEVMNKGEKNNAKLILNVNKFDPQSEDHLLSSPKEKVDNSTENKMKIDNKKFKKYKKILSIYIEFRENLELNCEKKEIYIVNKENTEELIKLYNIITKERLIEVDKDKIIEEKLTNFLERQEEFKFNFPVYAYSDCVKCLNSKNLDNKRIDLLNKELYKKLELKNSKGNQVTYINKGIIENNRYVLYKDNKEIKTIKINKFGGIFYLDKIVDKIEIKNEYITKKNSKKINNNTIHCNINKNVIITKSAILEKKDDISLEITRKNVKENTSIENEKGTKIDIVDSSKDKDNKEKNENNLISERLEVNEKNIDIISQDNKNVKEEIDKNKKELIISIDSIIGEKKEEEKEKKNEGQNNIKIEEEKEKAHAGKFEEKKNYIIINIDEKKEEEKEKENDNEKNNNIESKNEKNQNNIEEQKENENNINKEEKDNKISNNFEEKKEEEKEDEKEEKEKIEKNEEEEKVEKKEDEEKKEKEEEKVNENSNGFKGKKEEEKQESENNVQKKEDKNNINEILLRIFLLYKIQNKKLLMNNINKISEIFYLINKSFISEIINILNKNSENKPDINTLINNFLESKKDLNDVKNIINQFKIENSELFKDKNDEYNNNIINYQELLLEKKEIINHLNEKMNIPANFILINMEIYNLLLNLLYKEKNEDTKIININQVELINNNNMELVLKKINEENSIYICSVEDNNEVIFFNVLYIMIYNSSEIFFKECDILSKISFGEYCKEKNLERKNHIEKIYEQDSIEIGYLINININISDIKEPLIEEKEDMELKRRKIGLKNISSNSYLNSLLICLFNIPKLTNFFIDKLKEEYFINNQDIQMDDLEIKSDSLAFKYLEIIYYLYHKKQNSELINSFSPKKILEYLHNSDQKQFKEHQENNPQLLFLYIYEEMKKDLRPNEYIKSLSSIDSLSNSIKTEELLYKKFYINFKYNNNTIIDTMFTGIISSNMQCDSCSDTDMKFNSFSHFEFHLSKIPKKSDEDIIRLKDCFEYKQTEKLEQYCICSSQNINYINKIRLAPEILVIFLKDITDNKYIFKIDFEININEYSKEINNGYYRLIGIVSYFKQGGANPRYYSYCYDDNINKWICYFNDFIYDVDNVEEDMKRTNKIPYILFYQNLNDD